MNNLEKCMLLTPSQLLAIESYQAQYKPSEGVLRAAVSLILRDNQGHTECLMMQRAYCEKDPWSGHMGFPGGKIESSDISAYHGAVRESIEEVSVDLKKEDYLGRLDDVYGYKINQKYNVHLSCFVFKPKRKVIPKGNYEVADLVWVKLSRLKQKQYSYTYFHPLAPTRKVPAITLNAKKEQILWGLSLRVFLHLFTVVEQKLSALSTRETQELEAIETVNLERK